MLAAKTDSLHGVMSGSPGQEVVELRPKSRAPKRKEGDPYVTGPANALDRRWVFYQSSEDAPSKRPCPPGPSNVPDAQHNTSQALPPKPAVPNTLPPQAELLHRPPPPDKSVRWHARMTHAQTRNAFAHWYDKPLLVVVVLMPGETPATARGAYHATVNEFYLAQHDQLINSALGGPTKSARILVTFQTFRCWVGADPSSFEPLQPWYFRQMLRNFKNPHVLCGLTGDVSNFYDIYHPNCRLNREILDFSKTVLSKFYVYDEHGARLPGTVHTGVANRPAASASALPPAPAPAPAVPAPAPTPAPAPAPALAPIPKKPVLVAKTHTTNLESYLKPSMHPFVKDEIEKARAHWKKLKGAHPSGTQLTPETAMRRMLDLCRLAETCKKRLGPPLQLWISNILEELEQREWAGTTAPEHSDAYNMAILRGAQVHRLNIFAEIRGDSAEASRNRVVNPVELEVFNKERMLNRRSVKRSETLLAKWTAAYGQASERAASAQTAAHQLEIREVNRLIERVRTLMRAADARRAQGVLDETKRKSAVDKIAPRPWTNPFDGPGLENANAALSKAERTNSVDDWKSAVALTEALITAQTASSDANAKEKLRVHAAHTWFRTEVERAKQEIEDVLSARVDLETAVAFKAMAGKQAIIDEFVRWCEGARTVDRKVAEQCEQAQRLYRSLGDKESALARFGEAMRRKLKFVKSGLRSATSAPEEEELEEGEVEEEEEEVACTGQTTWAERDAKAREACVDLDEED